MPLPLLVVVRRRPFFGMLALLTLFQVASALRRTTAGVFFWLERPLCALLLHAGNAREWHKIGCANMDGDATTPHQHQHHQQFPAKPLYSLPQAKQTVVLCLHGGATEQPNGYSTEQERKQTVVGRLSTVPGHFGEREEGRGVSGGGDEIGECAAEDETVAFAVTFTGVTPTPALVGPGELVQALLQAPVVTRTSAAVGSFLVRLARPSPWVSPYTRSTHLADSRWKSVV